MSVKFPEKSYGPEDMPIGLAVKHKLSFTCPTGLMADSEHFGTRIFKARLGLAARLGRQVTQDQVAGLVGVTQGTVGRWEGGLKEPDLATFEKLGKALGVDPRWLAFGDVPRGSAEDSASGEGSGREGDAANLPPTPPTVNQSRRGYMTSDEVGTPTEHPSKRSAAEKAKRRRRA